MKTSKTRLSLLLINIILASCGKDPDPNQSAMLVGNWENTRYVSTGCTDPGDNENTTCSVGCEILVITATTLTVIGDDQYSYTASGNSLTIDLGAGPEVLAFDVSNTELTFTHQSTPAQGGCKSVSTYKKYDNKVTDVDGNVYNTVFIGEQEWMKENLKTRHYSSGAEIPNLTDASAWVTTYAGAYSDYDNQANNAQAYGRLYNLHAAKDIRNVCPTGWHVPNLDEWSILISTLGGPSVAGGKMKSNSDLWYSPNQGASNESGFSALPAGTRFDAGDFRDLHAYAHWRSWDGASIRLQSNNTGVELFYNYETNGTSIRCIRDE